MNYTCLIVGAFLVAMSLAWYLEGRKSFSPPCNDDVAIPAQASIEVIDGVEPNGQQVMKEEYKGKVTVHLAS